MKQAYIDLHTQQARTMVFDNKKNKAHELDEKRKVVAVQLE